MSKVKEKKRSNSKSLVGVLFMFEKKTGQNTYWLLSFEREYFLI